MTTIDPKLLPFYLKVTRMLSGDIVETEPVSDESIIVHYKDGSAVKLTVESVISAGSETLH